MSRQYYEYLIVGGGPAGLQAAYELHKSNKDYLVLEAESSPGAFFEQFPRHGKLISINKVHTGYSDPEINLRWDWNSLLTHGDDTHLFSRYSKKYFPASKNIVDYLKDFAEMFSLKVETDAGVRSVGKSDVDGRFQLTLANGKRLSADILIVATGLQLPWLPDIPGIENAVSYCDMSLDFSEYTGKRVLIIGKGNSAFETADALIEHASMIHLCSPNSLNFAWSSHYVGHLRAVNNNFLDTYHLKSQNAVLDADIQSIEKSTNGGVRVNVAYKHAEGEVESIHYDHVIACTGFKFDDSIYEENCKPILCDKEKFPVQNSDWESENVPGLYFAGTLMQQRDYRKYMSGFIHGFRYNVRTLVKLLIEKNEEQAYPERVVPRSERSVSKWIIDRANTTSALWQQPGFLGDVFVLNSDDTTITIYEELPVDYIHDRWGETGLNYFVLTLEYGEKKFENPFNVSRIARGNVENSDRSNFLHPIIRRHKNGSMISKHHMIENLFAEWKKPEHIEPMVEYFKAEFQSIDALYQSDFKWTGNDLRI